MLAVVYVLVKYAPKLVAAHMEFIEAAKQQGKHCVDLHAQHDETLHAILELVAEKMDPRGDGKYRDHVFSTVRTNHALRQFADVVEELSRGLPQEAVISSHLETIRETLKDKSRWRRDSAVSIENRRRRQRDRPG